MIRRLISALCFLLVAPTGNCQYNDLMLNGFDHGATRFTGSYLGGSPNITNGLYSELRQGGYFPGDLLKKLEDALVTENIGGSYTHYDLTSIFPLKGFAGMDSVYGIAGAGYYQVQDLRVHENAVLLAMHGNLDYEGMNLPIGPVEFQVQKFQQWKLGLMKVSQNSTGKFYAGFTFGVNLGLQQMHVDVKEASLYTAPFGEHITLYTHMGFSRSAPEPFSPFRVQGAGPAFDFYYAWVSSQKTSFAISFTQLGFIIWNRNSYSYQRDTTYRFDGVTIDNVFMMGEDWDHGLTNDTLDKLFNLYGEPRRHYTSLPVSVSISVQRKLHPHPFTLRGEFTYRHQTQMRPYGSVSLDWHATRKLILSRTYAYGGYSRFSSGISMKINVLKTFWLQAGSNALYPALSTESPLHVHFFGALEYRPTGAKSTNKDAVL